MVAPRPGGWCPPGGCPARLGEQLQHAVALAFEQGRRYERAELAQLDTTWPPLARRTWEQGVAQRMAEMDSAARARAAREGRPYRPHPGGPVDWETGQPLRRLEIAA